MLLQTALYLTSVLSAIALIALILVQDRPDDVRRRFAGLRRATGWSAGTFLRDHVTILGWFNMSILDFFVGWVTVTLKY